MESRSLIHFSFGTIYSTEKRPSLIFELNIWKRILLKPHNTNACTLKLQITKMQVCWWNFTSILLLNYLEALTTNLFTLNHWINTCSHHPVIIFWRKMQLKKLTNILLLYKTALLSCWWKLYILGSLIFLLTCINS